MSQIIADNNPDNNPPQKTYGPGNVVHKAHRSAFGCVSPRTPPPNLSLLVRITCHNPDNNPPSILSLQSVLQLLLSLLIRITCHKSFAYHCTQQSVIHPLITVSLATPSILFFILTTFNLRDIQPGNSPHPSSEPFPPHQDHMSQIICIPFAYHCTQQSVIHPLITVSLATPSILFFILTTFHLRDIHHNNQFSHIQLLSNS
jgi:hypothetical protein